MPHTIMVVDDEIGALTLARILFNRAGFDVLTARDSDTALAMLEDQLPDLFLLDAMMPGIHGIELCQILRSREDTREIPIVMHTTQTDAETVMRSLEAGANDFMPKPMMDHGQFVSRIRQLIASTEDS